MTKFQEKLVADGYCDERGAGFCATATKLKNINNKRRTL